MEIRSSQDFIKKERSRALKRKEELFFVVKSLKITKLKKELTLFNYLMVAFYVFPSCKGYLLNEKKTKIKKDTDFVQKLLEIMPLVGMPLLAVAMEMVQ